MEIKMESERVQKGKKLKVEEGRDGTESNMQRKEETIDTQL